MSGWRFISTGVRLVAGAEFIALFNWAAPRAQTVCRLTHRGS
jgi:hypothetical protein